MKQHDDIEALARSVGVLTDPKPDRPSLGGVAVVVMSSTLVGIAAAGYLGIGAAL